MYPYNRNPQKNISIREDVAQNPSATELSSDKRLLSLLELALQETTQLMERYHHMMTEVDILQPAENIIKSMYLDEKKHRKQLREAYYIMTGTAPKMPDTQHAYTHTQITDPKNYMEETFLQELDCCDFYRNFLLCVPHNDLRDIFFEILTDKQSHANIFPYLHSKYFC